MSDHSDVRDRIPELVEAAKAGSAEALGQLLEELRPFLLALANAEIDESLRSKGGASDLVQETCIDAHRDIHRFRGHTRQELFAWLEQILRNNIVNFARSYRGTEMRDLARELSMDGESAVRRAGEGVVAEIPSPRGEAIRAEQQRRLEDALAVLPDEYRRVILLRQVERLEFKEIGEQLGKTREAARKLWLRALLRLRSEMASSHDA